MKQNLFKISFPWRLLKREQEMFKVNAALMSFSLFHHLLALLAKFSYKGVQLYSYFELSHKHKLKSRTKVHWIVLDFTCTDNDCMPYTAW